MHHVGRTRRWCVLTVGGQCYDVNPFQPVKVDVGSAAAICDALRGEYDHGAVGALVADVTAWVGSQNPVHACLAVCYWLRAAVGDTAAEVSDFAAVAVGCVTSVVPTVFSLATSFIHVACDVADSATTDAVVAVCGRDGDVLRACHMAAVAAFNACLQLSARLPADVVEWLFPMLVNGAPGADE